MEEGARLCSFGTNDKMIGNGTELRQGRLSLDIRSFFTMRVLRHWHRLLLNGNIVRVQAIFGGEKLRVRLVWGGSGVLGRVMCSWRSGSSRAVAFSLLLWHRGKLLSFTVLSIMFCFLPDKRNLVL